MFCLGIEIKKWCTKELYDFAFTQIDAIIEEFRLVNNSGNDIDDQLLVKLAALSNLCPNLDIGFSPSKFNKGRSTVAEWSKLQNSSSRI